MKKLSIIILSYNTADLLEKCLASIYAHAQGLDFEVIVVDNASQDVSCAMVEKKFPQVKLIQCKKNLGYAKGNNFGAQKAQGKYFFFLNSDTEIIGESLTIMVELMEKNELIGILGPKFFYPDGSTQNSVGNFYSLTKMIAFISGAEKILGITRRSPDKFEFVEWISGAAFLIRSASFKKLGGFSEELFMYMEEVELCYRAKLAGMKTAFTPEAKIIHKELGSAKEGKKQAMLGIYQGLIYFYKKYFPAWQLSVLKMLLKTKAVVYIVVGFLIGNKNLQTTYEQAFRLVK